MFWGDIFVSQGDSLEYLIFVTNIKVIFLKKMFKKKYTDINRDYHKQLTFIKIYLNYILNTIIMEY